MWHELAIALCLLCVLEGLLPFLSPRRWRDTMLAAAQLDDRSMRLVGLVSMMLGVAMLYWIRG